MAKLSADPDAHAAIYRGVWYSLRRDPSGDRWEYQMRIATETRSGRVICQLSLLAIQRVKQMIDREV